MTQEVTAVLGAGTIGMSWAALFAATGREVRVFDPAPDTHARVAKFVETAAPALSALGWDHAGDMARIHVGDDPVSAVQGADFIQESVPEKLDIKHALYAQIAPVLGDDAILATSTSGLNLSQLQAGLRDPSRLVLGHPFNPPHLIPLVEIMANEHTAPDVLPRAQAFYESIGKTCVRLNKEVTGHIANRLQAALWREALYLAQEGVATVEDIDKAISHGPGLRWAALGPSSLFHLGGGPGGMAHFCDHLAAPMQSWWDALGRPDMTADVIETVCRGVDDMMEGRDMADMARFRDQVVLDILRAKDAAGDL